MNKEELTRAYIAKCDKFDTLLIKSNAQASLIKSFDESKTTYKYLYNQSERELRHALDKAKTVDSERAMNAELTKENQHLQSVINKKCKENESVRKILDYVLDCTHAPSHVRLEIKEALALTATNEGTI